MEQRALVVAVAANFTADLVEPTVRYLLDRLRIPHRVELAGYNQVHRELVDRSGLFARNRDGVDVALLRLADLGRPDGKRKDRPDLGAMREGAREIANLVAGHCGREGAPPLLVVICPEPRAFLGDSAYAATVAEIEASLANEVRAAGAQAVTSAELLDLYPVEARDDAEADVVGHIPYTAEMFAAIGAVVARKVRARVAAPYKVLALDADNTLWSGVVGEDGADGVAIDEGRVALQRFAVAQHEAGMLLAVCSKNVEEDVEEVFRRRQMPLERRHLVTSRVNWQPKSANLRAIAAELSLGLDSFVFVDDSLVECAEVRASCPEVLTIHVPQSSAAAAVQLRHVWAFDRWKVTEEDRQRSELYRQNVEREKTRREAPSMAEFLASLDLQIRIEPPEPADMPRVSQLTFRTNQFNFTTVRRSEAEIAGLVAEGYGCLKVHVRDRFGDYGLVGVMIFGPKGDALVVDTLLLSCRVLQRGVEHAMLARLGAIAVERGLARIDAKLAFTAKNLPAQQFLRSVGERWLTPDDGGFTVRFPSAEAAALVYAPDDGPPPAEIADEGKPKKAVPALAEQTEVLESIARELATAAAIVAQVAPRGPRKPRPLEAQPPVAPRSEAERAIAEICEEALGVAPVGVTDDLFLDLGATSIMAAQIAARIVSKLGRDVHVETVQMARTVEQLAAPAAGAHANRAAEISARVTAGRSPAIHALRAGGKKRPLFLGRPATRSGGGLSYVALARQIDPDRPVYVFQNRPLLDGTEPYSTIEEMASEYLTALRQVQPRGPYLIAGWCLGGKTAFEMANRLVDRGEQVNQLILFDTKAPGGLREQAEFLARREITRAELRAFARYPWLTRVLPWIRVARAPSMMRRFGVLAYFEHDNDDVALIDYAFPRLFDRRALAGMSPEARWQHVYTTLQSAEPEAGDGINAAGVRRGYKYFAWDHRLDAMYAPRWVYPGNVAMLTVRGGASLAAGWAPLLSQKPEVHEFDVKGTKAAPDPHSAMMAEENVKLMAGELNRLLGSE
ncbi:MAG: HAD-IIIC family phosphatase [Minicystis sp.]